MSALTVNPIVLQDNLQNTNRWQMALDSSLGGTYGIGLGEVLLGVAEIEQSIQIILTTLPGTDPMRPTFGLNYLQFMDLPINQAAPLMVSLISLALSLWEPRISVVSIIPFVQGTQGILAVAIEWTYAGQPQSSPQTTTIVVGS